MLDRLEGSDWTLDQALNGWWTNVRSTGGLRLNITGYDVFRNQAQMPYYEFDVAQRLLTAGNLILLDHRMTCAYHLARTRSGSGSLVLFDSREAVLLTLYGDVAQWLESLRLQQDS